MPSALPWSQRAYRKLLHAQLVRLANMNDPFIACTKHASLTILNALAAAAKNHLLHVLEEQSARVSSAAVPDYAHTQIAQQAIQLCKENGRAQPFRLILTSISICR